MYNKTIVVEREYRMIQSNRFNLLRYFSIISLLLIISIGASIIWISREILITQLIESGETANVALTESLSNSMWNDNSEYITSVSEANGDILRARPETRQIHQDVSRLVSNLPVLKVKIYTTDAITIYSSESSQIGESKAENAGFLVAAEQGKPSSKMSRRGTFSAFSGQVSNVSLVETYVPKINKQSRKVEAVFELYTDVTNLVTRIDNTIIRLIWVIGGLFLLLYIALLYAMGIANKTIRKQHEELEQHQQDLRLTNNAMLSEIAARKKVEQELVRSKADAKDYRVLPAVSQMSKEIARVFLGFSGPEGAQNIKHALAIWKQNKTHGPSSLGIFITLLSRKLPEDQRSNFESRARECIRI